MRRLLKYLRPYRLQCVLAPLFKLLEACMDLMVPLAVAAIINGGIAAGDRGVVLSRFGLLIALAVAGMLFSFTAQWFAARASVGFATRVRQALFDHAQRLSPTAHDRVGADALITRLTSDVGQVQNGVNLALRLLLRSPFIVFGAMVMAFTIDARAALTFAVVIPVLLAVVFGVMALCIPLYGKVQGALDGLLGKTRENLTGVRVIRAFGREQDEVAAFDARNEALTRMNEFVGRLSAIMNPATYLIVNLATAALIYVGALRVDGGALRQGDVVALYNYMAQIIVELIKLASLIITINRSLACARRVADVMDVAPGLEYGDKALDAAASDEAVRFDDVSYAYPEAGAEALTGISFTARAGQTIGVIGGTGCGKSTLMGLIARSFDATGGRVSLFGRDVREYAQGEVIRHVGVVPQQALLFEGTIRSNLLWGDENADDEALWRAVDMAQAREVVTGKGGLDAAVEQGGRNFSGGQRQRLTIARALVKGADILILDDSASALDYATDRRLRQALASLRGRATVFIVSQRAASVMQADRILVLEDGRLVGSGTHDQLMADCPAYEEIVRTQMPEGVRA